MYVTNFVFRVLNSGFFQVQFLVGKECIAIEELYNLLKDHRNSYMPDILAASSQHNYQEEFSSLIGMSPTYSLELQDCGTENVGVQR